MIVTNIELSEGDGHIDTYYLALDEMSPELKPGTRLQQSNGTLYFTGRKIPTAIYERLLQSSKDGGPEGKTVIEAHTFDGQHPIYSRIWMVRPGWDDFFMSVAKTVATRATCDRKHVGAVLVRDRTILSTGYNGSIRGTEHCDSIGHMLVHDPERGGPSCVRTVHAEANAITQAAMNGVSTKGATIYTSASPCWNCFKLIANSGIKRIVFGELYRDKRIYDFARVAGIELAQLSHTSAVTGDEIHVGAETPHAAGEGSKDR